MSFRTALIVACLLSLELSQLGFNGASSEGVVLDSSTRLFMQLGSPQDSRFPFQLTHSIVQSSQSAKAMRYIVTLKLTPPSNSLDTVRNLPGFKEVLVDEAYGLVPISPKRNLYVIRVLGDLDPTELMSIQPEVTGVHGDLKIEPFDTQ